MERCYTENNLENLLNYSNSIISRYDLSLKLGAISLLLDFQNIEKFIEEKNIDKDLLFKGRNLSMEECILKDIRDSGIKEENIYSLPLCTHCTEEIKLHSYRKSKGLYGRMFSFVILN